MPLRELSSVVKELTAAMGGSVAVASQPSAGATFAVSMPVASVRPGVAVR